MRQTGLTFEDLLKEFDNPASRFPKCLLINEIGEIFENKKEQAAEAESFLRQLLANSDEDSHKFLAFCYLSNNSANEATAVSLKTFADNPQNAEIVARARATIKSRQAPNN